MSDDKKPITAEIMKAYVAILEKQVQQMTTVVTTLEELHEELEKIEGHFHNGFKSDITDHITEQVAFVTEKIEKALTTVYIIKDNVEKAADADKELNEKAYMLTDEIKEKISALKGDIAELKSATKVDRATNIVGWGTFILSMITIILKLFGKI